MTVALVVPIYRPTLEPDEQVSLRHLDRFLSSFDRFLVKPEGLELSLDGYRARSFGDRYFASRRGYSQLLLSKKFYRSFSAYEYILVYQLDCLVFADELLDWCERGYDYVAPPHTIGDRDPQVGNGGFSLRRVESFLAVLDSRIRTVDPRAHWAEHWAQKPALERWRNLPRRYAKRLLRFNGVQMEIKRLSSAYLGWAEDWFWTLQAEKYLPTFRRAPTAEGLRFGFNEAPRESFEALGRRLPFGCHGWNRFDREFWEPYLLR
jgi:hypothetical protein